MTPPESLKIHEKEKKMTPYPIPQAPRIVRPLVCAALLFVGGCGSGGGGTGSTAAAGGDADIVAVVAGRLVDVYGLRKTSLGNQIELYRTDVVVGSDIQDERDTEAEKRDEEITYDFFGVNPDNLQPRLLITRQLGSPQFQAAFAALPAKALRVAPAAFGQNTGAQPFSVVPRNAAYELVFSKDLGLSQDFFDARDQSGKVVSFKNPEAVQLLEIVGNPNDGDDVGDFRVVPARIVVRGASLIVDPVLLGSEGRQYNARNNARGLPESGNSTGANVRLAVAMEGPLRIPGIRAPGQPALLGKNNSRRKSVIRDFRSANRDDSGADISNGFVRDPNPPRIVGEMVMRLERVQVLSEELQIVTVYKAGVQHELDSGDVLSLFVDNSGVPAAVTEIIRNPTDDEGSPSVQHVQCQVRSAAGFLQHDPSRRQDYPTDPVKREQWLLENAPKVVVSAEYSGSKDLAKYFVTFAPLPLPDPGSPIVEPNVNVSPQAGAIIRFTKPVDQATVRAFDSFVLSSAEASTVLDPQKGTAHLIAARVADAGDDSQTAMRAQTPFGLYLDDSMRSTSGNRPYYLHVIGGTNGIRDLSGNPVDFLNKASLQESFTVEFRLDIRKTGTNENLFPNNKVVSVVRRFLAADEDELLKTSSKNFNDFFGAIVLQNGRASGRPTARTSQVVDDRNQISSPPDTDPLAFCAVGEVHTNTGLVKFGQPVQNPMNPLGGRLQTCWREFDLSLSRTDPFDFNVDVEQMHWAPHGSQTITYDEFDRTSLFIGHSERRPSPCVGTSSSLPNYPSSGLSTTFENNYVRNMKADTSAIVEERPNPHVAYVDQVQKVLANLVFYEPKGINRFMPLPKFEKPYLTWRDERLMLQGGGMGDNKVVSPFPRGWDNATSTPAQIDGKVGSIALPLLADFYYYPDQADLPKDNPFQATGFNGWQIALAVTSSAQPDFRVYSAGGYGPPGFPKGTKNTVDPATKRIADGGYQPGNGAKTPPNDNSVYWIQVDFLKRISAMTYGFIRLGDPHRAAVLQYGDPRLGPYYPANAPLRPTFDVFFEPLASELPPGTRVIPEFRAAKQQVKTDDIELNPLIAGEVHIRNNFNTSTRLFDYNYVDALTRYTTDIGKLQDANFLAGFSGMRPQDVKWLSFRLLFENNVEATGSVSPTIDSFAIAYRLDAY